MTEHDDELNRDLLEKSKAAFDDSVRGLDAAARARLREARMRALAELESRPWFAAPKVWVPAGAALALALAVVPLLERSPPGTTSEFGAVAAADLELLLSDEELEMLAELEFYDWLDAENVMEPGGEIEDGVG